MYQGSRACSGGYAFRPFGVRDGALPQAVSLAEVWHLGCPRPVRQQHRIMCSADIYCLRHQQTAAARLRVFIT